MVECSKRGVGDGTHFLPASEENVQAFKNVFEQQLVEDESSARASIPTL